MFWSAYRNTRGPLNVGRRVEQAVGNLMSFYAAFKGSKNVNSLDFMPWEDKPPEVEMSFDDYMMMQFGDGTKAP